MERIEHHASFDGWQDVYQHESTTLGCTMKVGVYLPPQAQHGKVPVLYWLSGLTCTEQNFITKSAVQRYAAEHGIAVFNSPFSNSRSVAELVIAEIIALARQLGDRSNEMHNGTWNKVSNKCWEIRGKTLGMLITHRYQFSTNVCVRYNWLWPYRRPTVGSSRGYGHVCYFLRRSEPDGTGYCSPSTNP